LSLIGIVAGWQLVAGRHLLLINICFADWGVKFLAFLCDHHPEI